MFSPNTGKYGPEKTPYLDTFPAVVAGMRKIEASALVIIIIITIISFIR